MDFVLDDRVAIEAKSTRRVQQKHLRSLRALAEERLIDRSIVVCREDRPRVENGIEIWPLEFFLRRAGGPKPLGSQSRERYVEIPLETSA